MGVSADSTDLDVRDWRIWMRPLLAALVIVGLMLWLYWDFFGRQFRWAIQKPDDWGHTLVIPLIAGYFIWLRREPLLAKPFRTTWVGLLPVLLGMAWYMACVFGPTPLMHHNLRAAGVGMTLFGLVLLFFGFRAMIWLWFPLAYVLVFGQAISDRFMLIITQQLQDWSAQGAYFTLNLLGLNTAIEGNTLTVIRSDMTEAQLNVAEACSGIRMLMAFLALGVAMAFTGFKRFWQQAALVLMGVPTALFVNILRVTSLGLLAIVNPDFAAGEFHATVGLLWLFPAFLIYLGIVWVLRHMVIEEPVKATKKPARTKTRRGTA
jgi:exosortase